MHRILSAIVLSLFFGLGAFAEAPVSITIMDNATGGIVPGRVHLLDAKGQPVVPESLFPLFKQYFPEDTLAVSLPPGVLPFFKNFVIEGKTRIGLPEGAYRYEIERGPEWSRQRGRFTVGPSEAVVIEARLDRWVDMNAEGWYSGDLHVHSPPEFIPLLMRAEELNIAPVITWWNNKDRWAGTSLPAELLINFEPNRFYRILAGEDERAGGALLFCNLQKPLNIHGLEQEYPPSWHFLKLGKQQPGAHIDIEKPFWLDTPIWAASGLADSIGICHNHMHRNIVYDGEAWGKQRDRSIYPGAHGNALWTHDIYFHLLNSGLRLPPSAGSACGAQPLPLGYNRVYVYQPDGLTWDGWWRGLRAGRSFVTNGPFLRVSANGRLPGHRFTAPEGTATKIDLRATLQSQDRIEVVQVIVNGEIVRKVRPDPTMTEINLGELEFEKSGWFLVRAITDVAETFRFAASAPFYVEVGDTPHISRASAEFFVAWLEKRRASLAETLTDAQQRREVLPAVQEAEQFWKDRMLNATAP